MKLNGGLKGCSVGNCARGKAHASHAIGGPYDPAAPRFSAVLGAKELPPKKKPTQRIDKKKTSDFKYEIILYWSKKDGAFIAEVPELAGCAADGKTYQKR